MTNPGEWALAGEILVVDDNELIRDMLSRRLARQGHIVATAVDGTSALALIGKHRFDVILLDVMMPGMDGFEVLKHIRIEYTALELPVIMVTAKDQSEDVVRALMAGANDYVAKPVDFPVALARLSTQLTLRRSQEALRKAHSRMEQELEFGRTVQMTLVPEVSSVLSNDDNLVAAATLRPAHELGGDFYDILRSSDGRVWFCIGDVSGKGVAAALFMAVAKTLFASLVSELPSPREVVTRMNNELAKYNPSAMFVTFFVAVIEPDSGNITFTNAGHNPPFVCRGQDGVDLLDARHGPVLGAVEDLDYGEDQLTLQESDALFLYTDGVTEAKDVDGKLYGEQRVLDVLRSTSKEPSAIVTAIVDSVDAFAGTKEQADDITIFVIRRGTTASVRHSQTN